MPFPLCLNSNTYHGFSLEDAVEGASRAGLHLIELAAVAGYTEHVLPDADDARIADIQGMLRGAGIRAIALGGHSDLTSADGRARFVRNLVLAGRLGVAYVVTGTGETHGDETQIDDESAFAAELRALGHRARLEGVSIAIETHGANYPTGAAMARLVQATASPDVGIAYDTGNTIFYGDVAPYDDLAAALPRVTGLHLKDKRGGPGVWDFPAIGSGDTDFERIGRILRAGESGRVVPLSIEIEFTPEGPASVEDVHDALVRSVMHLRSLGFRDEGVRA